MDADDGKPTVTIRTSGRQNFDPASREALLELRNLLAESDEYEVRYPIYKTADTLQATLEHVGLFIAGSVSGTLLTLIVTDTYNKVTHWLKDRFTNDEDASPVYVTLYGPDGKPLKNILGKGIDHIKDVTPEKREHEE